MQLLQAAEERGYESTQIPPVDYPDERERFDKWTVEGKPMSAKYIMEMKSKYGIPSLDTGLPMFNVLIVRDGLRMTTLRLIICVLSANANEEK